MCHAQKDPNARHGERETLHNYWPLVASMDCFEGEYINREKAARCHKGIALSLLVTIDIFH